MRRPPQTCLIAFQRSSRPGLCRLWEASSSVPSPADSRAPDATPGGRGLWEVVAAQGVGGGRGCVQGVGVVRGSACRLCARALLLDPSLFLELILRPFVTVADDDFFWRPELALQRQVKITWLSSTERGTPPLSRAAVWA